MVKTWEFGIWELRIRGLAPVLGGEREREKHELNIRGASIKGPRVRRNWS